MASKLFISAKEVAKELEVSDSYAYRLIRQLNAELEQKGFVVVKGKIGSLTLAHSQNSQMSFMYGFFFVKFLFFTVVCVVIVV